MTTLADLLARVKKPVRVVDLCFREDLVLEIEALGADLARALLSDQAGDSLGSVAARTAPPIAARILELEEEAANSTKSFDCHPVQRSVWAALKDANPPSEEDRAKGYGVDQDGWFVDAVQTCCTVDGEPVSEDMAQALVEQLTTRQYDDLAAAIYAVNEGVVDLPKSAVASARTPVSGPSATTASPSGSHGDSSSETVDTPQ